MIVDPEKKNYHIYSNIFSKVKTKILRQGSDNQIDKQKIHMITKYKLNIHEYKRKIERTSYK